MSRVRSGRIRVIAVATLMLSVMVGCGSSDSAADTRGDDDRPTIVVTTNILGDVVGDLIGDQADVVTIMPVGADPHDFQASAREVDRLLRADALIVNGARFEEGLVDVIESARRDGVPIFEAMDAVEAIAFTGDGHDHDDSHDEGEDHDDDHDEGDSHDEGEDHDDHDEGEDHHEGIDPHFFTDPVRMADVVRAAATFIRTEVDGVDEDTLDQAVDVYLAELDALDAEVAELLAAVPEERRVLVTNHEVFGYFADRYGFEVVGAVVPGGSTVDSTSAGELAELARLIEAEGVPAIFADTSSSSALAETLAAEVGDVSVVELYSESLGEPGTDGATYLDMVRANAARISEALA